MFTSTVKFPWKYILNTSQLNPEVSFKYDPLLIVRTSLMYNFVLKQAKFCLKKVLWAYNHQKWKSQLFTCPCHNTHRVEAVGLSLSNYIFRIMIFVKM